MNNERLYLPESPYLHVIEATTSEITDFGWSLTKNDSKNVVVRFLRGRRMATLASLYDEFAASLQFPYYFGENWNAFDECLTDLSWIAGDVYVLIITDAISLLIDESNDQLQVFTNLLNEAGSEWSIPVETSEAWGHQATPFHVIFQSDEPDKQGLISRLDRVAAHFDELTITAGSKLDK